jgi:hypothetical protein
MRRRGALMSRPDEGLIHAWLDGELDAVEAARVERLVRDDAEWAAAAAEARGLIAATARIVGALDDVPAGVVRHAGPAVPGRATGVAGAGDMSGVRAPGRPWWMVRAAAVIVVVAGTAVVLTRGGPEVAELAPAAASQTGAAPATADAPVPAPGAGGARGDAGFRARRQRDEATAANDVRAKELESPPAVVPPQARQALTGAAPQAAQQGVAGAAQSQGIAAPMRQPPGVPTAPSVALADQLVRRAEERRERDVRAQGRAGAAASGDSARATFAQRKDADAAKLAAESAAAPPAKTASRVVAAPAGARAEPPEECYREVTSGGTPAAVFRVGRTDDSTAVARTPEVAQRDLRALSADAAPPSYRVRGDTLFVPAGGVTRIALRTGCPPR